MPRSGGYKVIDLAHKPLSNFATVYPGIYNDIESSNKMCVVSGLFAGGVEYDDFAVLFTGGTTLNGKVTDSLQLVITDDDEVTVAVSKPAQSTDFVDMTGVTIDSNGLVTDYNIKVKFLTLIRKGDPFYIKGLSTSGYFNMGFEKANVMVSSMAFVSNQEADICFVLGGNSSQEVVLCTASISAAEGIVFMKSAPVTVTNS